MKIKGEIKIINYELSDNYTIYCWYVHLDRGVFIKKDIYYKSKQSALRAAKKMAERLKIEVKN